jgi:hypothetical protein
MNRIAFSTLALGIVTAGFAQTTFQVKVENLGPQGLSPVFWSVGNFSFDIFSLGGTASQGIKDIAEGGNTTAMLGIAAAAGADVSSYGVLAGGSIAPGQMRMGTFTTTSSHSYFSFASMLGRTNDGFIGEGVSSMGLSLFSGSTPQGFSIVIRGSRAWDAGTELNTQSSADVPAFGGSGNPADSNSAIRVHETIIPNVGDRWEQMPDWEQSTELARISVEPVPEPATMSALLIGLLALKKRKEQTNA